MVGDAVPRVPRCLGTRGGTVPGTAGCTLCLQPKIPSRMGRGSFWSLRTEGGQIYLFPLAPSLHPHWLCRLVEGPRQGPGTDFHPGTALSGAAGAPGSCLGGWRDGDPLCHHPLHVCALREGGQTLPGDASAAQLDTGCCVCVYHNACALRRDGEEAVGML